MARFKWPGFIVKWLPMPKGREQDFLTEKYAAALAWV
jgi:hypothetical protein